MSKSTLPFLCIFVLSLFACEKADSEQDVLNEIEKINKLHALERKGSNDSALFYLSKARKIIDSNNILPDTLLMENIFRKGYYYKQINQLDSATHYFHKTINLIKKPNNRARNTIYFRNTWLTDEAYKRDANAINVAKRFIEISGEKNKGLTYAYNLLERLHLDMGDTEKALFYNAKALKAAKESSNEGMFMIALKAKAKFLYNSGKKEQAFKFLDSLSTIKTESGLVLRQLHQGLGVFHYYDEDYELAIEKYKEALKYSREENNLLIETYNNVSEAYIQLKEYEMAKKYLDSTKAIIVDNSLPEAVNFYKKLRFRLHYRTHASESEVLEEYDNLIEHNKKEHQGSIDEKLNELIEANEKEKIATAKKKDAEIENFKLIALLGFSGVLMLLGVFFYRQRRFKFEKQDMQMQQRLLRSQMNPHFTFNTLSIIQDQIEKNEEGATKYLLKFSRLLRLILENSLSNYVLVENELEVLRKYLDLQLLRFPEKFSYDIVLEDFEEDEMLFIPSMLIQPFIENSVEHGFLGIKYKGEINIKLKLNGKYLSCIIEDNGQGLKKTNNNYKTSVSTTLISKFIKKTTKRKIIILDKKSEKLNGSGVLVKFLIPYKFSDDD